MRGTRKRTRRGRDAGSPAGDGRQCRVVGQADQGDKVDRGISDLLAHVLVFAIIIAGVALISTGAFDPLTEASDREQIENSQRGLQAAASTLDDIQRQSATRRSFSLATAGGTVFLNQSFINVSSPNASGTHLNRTIEVNSLEHSLELEQREARLAYEGGAVFRTPSARARYHPTIQCGEDTAIVSLVELDAGNFYVSTGDDQPDLLNPRSVPAEAPVVDRGQVLLFDATLGASNRSIARFPAGDGTIRFNVTKSANSGQWENYLGRDASNWTNSTADIYLCNDLETAVVRVITIDIQTQ